MKLSSLVIALIFVLGSTAFSNDNPRYDYTAKLIKKYPVGAQSPNDTCDKAIQLIAEKDGASTYQGRSTPGFITLKDMTDTALVDIIFTTCVGTITPDIPMNVTLPGVSRSN